MFRGSSYWGNRSAGAKPFEKRHRLEKEKEEAPDSGEDAAWVQVLGWWLVPEVVLARTGWLTQAYSCRCMLHGQETQVQAHVVDHLKFGELQWAWHYLVLWGRHYKPKHRAVATCRCDNRLLLNCIPYGKGPKVRQHFQTAPDKRPRIPKTSLGSKINL